ncbi:hypothetical protein D3C76_1865310 [compost metagenome]
MVTANKPMITRALARNCAAWFAVTARYCLSSASPSSSTNAVNWITPPLSRVSM